jgi:hypothetical protein
MNNTVEILMRSSVRTRIHLTAGLLTALLAMTVMAQLEVTVTSGVAEPIPTAIVPFG